MHAPNGEGYDVIVAGAGISGMTAAIESARSGARVLVLEKDCTIGGNARWAFGFDIEGDDLVSLRATDADGDPALQRLLVAEFRPSIAWLGDIGVALEEGTPGRFNYVPCQGDGGADAFAALGAALADAGGEVLTEAPMSRLVVENGAVIGVETGGKLPRTVYAPAVILATGSFGRNAAMKRRYFGPSGHLTGYYGSYCHDGDGIAAALAVGASLTDGVAVPAGACIFPPPFIPPANSHRLGPSDVMSRALVPPEIQALLIRPQIDGRYMILLNGDGRRYVDESLKYSIIGIETTRQRQAVGFCIFDSRGHAADAHNLDCATRHGAAIYTASTIPALLDALRGWRGTGEQGAGQDSSAMAESIAAFNAAVVQGRGRSLDPPAAPDAAPIERPPFYAMPVVQGVNDVVGGLAIDGDMRVLARDGQPIPGLFAVGADGGRPYSIEHGGLAYGLVSGRIAGRRAATQEKGYAMRSMLNELS